jgi:peptidase M1-like protein
MRSRKLVLAFAVVVVSVVAIQGQSPFAPKVTGPLSQRVVAYQIDAKYDPGKHAVDATETLTYHNLTGQRLDHFPFHLYLNAFQPNSTWVHEAHRDRNFRASDFGQAWDPKHTGSNEVTSLEIVGAGDVTKHIKFISPDDGHPDDKTVFEVALPHPIEPGQDVVFKIKFRAVFPEVVARTGYKRTFLLAGQWFPKVGVWWNGAWNRHQFHAMTEFFADFGTYDVKITLPKSYVIGATGVQTSDTDNGDGTKTVAFHAEDVHDFAWTADPNYKVVESTFDGSEGAVKIRLLTYESNQSSWQRYIDVMQGTMKRFDEWYGPYPYAQITVVDPPHGAGEAGGMEYPTFITGDTFWWAPKGQKLFPEVVTEHEFGHQYWYGMVATNEFENAWLDEGINSYTEVKVMDSLFGKNTSLLNWMGAQMGESAEERMFYMGVAETDPLSRPSYLDMSMGSYGGVTYGKTATMLLTLENIVGEQVLQKALHVYFMKYRFAHPTQEDFLRTVNEVAGQDLGWYWQQAVYGTQVLDYKVRRADSTRVDWANKDAAEEKKGETTYETEILLQRLGDFVFPVVAQVKFDNGETIREKWDGRDRWKRLVYVKKAKVLSVEVDPDHQITMDRDYLNNSITTEPQRGAIYKIASYWMFCTQFLAQVLSWLT